jgi:ABC-type nitrate/sulfonate/bicarbonate transport system substrate-binding protein
MKMLSSMVAPWRWLWFVLIALLTSPTVYAEDISMVISPYQDLAMMVNIHPLGLDKRYGTTVKISTIPWQDTLPTLASRAGDVDIGFASLAEFLAKEENLNKGSDDPLLFIYPAYVFKGGAFVSFRKDLKPVYTAKGKVDKLALRAFLKSRMGFSKNTLYHMLVYQLAAQEGIPLKKLHIIDIPFDRGLLAAMQGDLDVTAVGLTQLTEALKQGGTKLFEMDDIGLADITGFVCKRSTLESKRHHIEHIIHMWFDSVSYVMTDLDKNSINSLDYLRQKAATRYTIEEYKTALAQEHFPLSIVQAKADMIDANGKYNYLRLYKAAADFYEKEKLVNRRPPVPGFITLD